ncbi:nucleotide-binding protein (plasmid) [Sorangium sp. So ce119]|uniref:TIR domain-containing protein n=1 Tax=Sorangium sp. So ce119 TaxID=3133279 RepID=UPI003F63E5C5
MRKSKRYRLVRFSADTIHTAIERGGGPAKSKDIVSLDSHIITHDDGSEWSYDNLDEFFADYRRYSWDSRLVIRCERCELIVQVVGGSSSLVEVTADARPQIEQVFDVFERGLATAHTYKSEELDPELVVFVGHGRSGQWRDLKDHLVDKHGIKVRAYETGARAGHVIRDILEEMVQEASFALLVLTAEDETADGTFRARQNVVHETGLFQGRLGFSRAIVLVEDSVEVFSNLDGVQQIRYSKGNIRETFGDVLATIRREFR